MRRIVFMFALMSAISMLYGCQHVAGVCDCEPNLPNHCPYYNGGFGNGCGGDYIGNGHSGTAVPLSTLNGSPIQPNPNNGLKAMPKSNGGPNQALPPANPIGYPGTTGRSNLKH